MLVTHRCALQLFDLGSDGKGMKIVDEISNLAEKAAQAIGGEHLSCAPLGVSFPEIWPLAGASTRPGILASELNGTAWPITGCWQTLNNESKWQQQLLQRACLATCIRHLSSYHLDTETIMMEMIPSVADDHATPPMPSNPSCAL